MDAGRPDARIDKDIEGSVGVDEDGVLGEYSDIDGVCNSKRRGTNGGIASDFTCHVCYDRQMALPLRRLVNRYGNGLGTHRSPESVRKIGDFYQVCHSLAREVCS